MSRTYSNFLLFENVLEGIPEGSSLLSQAVRLLLNPTVVIIEEDCDTMLGYIQDTSSELEGFTWVDTKETLDAVTINDILEAGKYKIGIRSTHTCLSKGGICRTCYESSFLGQETPEVGSTVTVPSKIIYQTDVLSGNGYTDTFKLSQTSDDYDEVKVVNQGMVVDSIHYTLGFDTITLDSIPVSIGDSIAGRYVVHFIKQNTDPFLGYIAKTYSGALLGLAPLPSQPMLLRESLYEAQFSDNILGLIVEEISKMKAIPTTYKDYLEKIHSRLEKVLLALYLYAIYGNVEL